MYRPASTPALGYDQLNLRGGSYGTQVALLATERSPETIRSVTLSSPVDPRENWVKGIPAGSALALDRVSAICAADPACRGAVGGLDAAIASTVDRLANQPEEVTVQPLGRRGGHHHLHPVGVPR